MSILTTTSISQSFGAVDLFSGIDLRLEEKERVGLVGANGCGKTTLLRILAGAQPPTSGNVTIAPHLAVGYLQQEAALTFANRAHSIYAEMLAVFNSLHEKETKMRELEAAMSMGDMTVMEEYGRLQEAYEHGGGYQYPHDIKRVLLGLGFPEDEWQTPLSHLSGGQQTRLSLGRLLLEKPELLILDEPTNHLDTATIEWLESTLQKWSGALIVVSHDRYFLDRVINRTWAMGDGSIRTYRGNYSAYAQQRREAEAREASLFASEQARLEQELAFVRKHIAGGRTDIAKGKLKRLTRDLLIIEQTLGAGESLDNLQSKSWSEIGGRVRTFSPNEAARHFRKLQPPTPTVPTMRVKFQCEPSGQLPFRADKLQIGYANTPLFSMDKIKLKRGERVALIGPNGCGKTTFLQTLLGETAVLRGWFKFGASVSLGYFAQAHDQLDPNKRVIDEVTSHSRLTPQEARTYLGQYLFRNDDVFKPVSALSGGERGRLALALLTMGTANFLLLDEPTNHLDIPSQEVLQEALEQFSGTILLVSHDRYLVSRLATQIWEIGEENGELTVFNGRYDEFVQEKMGKTAVLDPLSRLDDPTAIPANIIDPDWVDDIIDPAQATPLSQPTALDEQIAELEQLEASIADEITVAEAIGDEEMLAQLQDEYIVVCYQLAQLEADYQDS